MSLLASRKYNSSIAQQKMQGRAEHSMTQCSLGKAVRAKNSTAQRSTAQHSAAHRSTCTADLYGSLNQHSPPGNPINNHYTHKRRDKLHRQTIGETTLQAFWLKLQATRLTAEFDAFKCMLELLPSQNCVAQPLI